MFTAWRGQFQPKKIKRKNRFRRPNCRYVAIPDVVRDALELWHAVAQNTSPDALIFPAETDQSLGQKPMIPDNCLRLRLYPIAKELKFGFNPNFHVLRRSFSTHGKEDGHPTDM